MTALRTYFTNRAETTLSAEVGVGATVLNVVDTGDFPTVPFYVALDPAVDAKFEVVLVTAKTATTLTLSARGADGTADVVHGVGAPVKLIPVAAMFTDLHDRVDAIPTITVSGTAPVNPDVGDLWVEL